MQLFVTSTRTRVYLTKRHSVCAELLAARNIAEQLIEKGFATAVRHKRDDEDRSPEYDKLMAAEQA